MSHLEELDPAPQTGDSWCSLLAAPLSSQCNPLKKRYDRFCCSAAKLCPVKIDLSVTYGDKVGYGEHFL